MKPEIFTEGRYLVAATVAAAAILFGVNRGPLSASVTPPVNASHGNDTVWDGVYTTEQAKRGQKVYEKACIYCHLADLTGGSEAAAPPLVGTSFLSRWNQRPLADLFVVMAETMPKDGVPFGGEPPVEVELEEYLDIIAYVLMRNGAPSGNAELPADERLAQLVITQKMPGR